MNFDRDLQQLGFFLTHILTYIQAYGHKIPTKGARVRVVTLALERVAAKGMVILHNANAPKLRNFSRFMTALRCRFEDHLANCKAQDHIKMLKQGCHLVAEYTKEFWDLACHLDWAEDILV